MERYQAFEQQILRIFITIYNVFSNLYFQFYRLARWRMLKKNKALKASSEICYIIGNGPSVNNFDLYRIKNCDTFTVNFFHRASKYSKFDSTYHIAVDEGFYKGEAKKYLLDVSRKHENTKFILKSKGFVHMEKYNRNGNFFYVYAKLLQHGNFIRFDLRKNMTAAINVSIMAVQAALYLGYKKIYLIGFDFDEYVGWGGRHFYGIEENGSRVRGYTKGTELRWYSLAYQHHYALARWAKKHDVEIRNLSPESMLDAYPQGDFEQILHQTNEGQGL